MALKKYKQIILSALALLMVGVLSVASAHSGAYAVYLGGTPRQIPVYRVNREDKVVAITFDCAWGAEHTPTLLAALNAYGVKATFFCVQFWTEKYPDMIREIDKAGHEIGTHSATHSHMSGQTEAEIIAELTNSSQAISNLTGKEVQVFRPPFGDYNDRLIKTARGAGYHVIQWDVDSLDWKDLSAQDIALRVINRAQSGSIILMHNNGKHTAEAVPVILQTLQNKGYTFLPVGQLIYRENYTVDGQGEQHPVKAD